MATQGTQAQTTMDLELSSLRNSLDFLTDHNRPTPAHVEDQEYVPPDGGYGWVCVVCVFLINAHTWGLNFVSLASTVVFGSSWTGDLDLSASRGISWG